MGPNNAFLHTHLCTRYTLVISVCVHGGGGLGGAGGGAGVGGGRRLQWHRFISADPKLPVHGANILNLREY